jgi:urate oxidase
MVAITKRSGRVAHNDLEKFRILLLPPLKYYNKYKYNNKKWRIKMKNFKEYLLESTGVKKLDESKNYSKLYNDIANEMEAAFELASDFDNVIDLITDAIKNIIRNAKDAAIEDEEFDAINKVEKEFKKFFKIK